MADVGEIVECFRAPLGGFRGEVPSVRHEPQHAMTPIGLTEMVNRVFGDRYRVEELIGIGPISAVYTAYDSAEGRWVALKVFDEALAGDEAFVERLLEAVERAAVLGHPNIAEIYDWGVDGGPYIASELCEGGSLATMLANGDRLAASQALVVTLECTRALNYGHDQGFVHRALTPSNIMFSADEHVRISDYGLTDVLADAPVSQAARALENVRYASPEQARGRNVTEASDMYSLALVINEAVSGDPPYVAETVVGTLMERAESSAVLDPSLEGLLPSLERCGRVDPTERPEAEELSIALLAAAETMERPSPLPIAGLTAPINLETSTLQVAGGQLADLGVLTPEPATDDDFDVSALGELDDTMAFASDGIDEPSPVIELVPADQALVDIPSVDLELVADTAPAGALEDLEAAEPVFAASPDDEDGDEAAAALDVPRRTSATRSDVGVYAAVDDDDEDRLPWWPLVALVLLVAGAVAAGAYFFVLDGTDDAAVVPDLVGVPFDEVASQVDGQGWKIERLEGRLDGSVVGSVVSQSPAGGTDLGPGETLTVTVSLGNQMVEIPSDIIGLTVDQAASRLGSVGLGLGRISEEQNEALGAGLVIGLDEPTTQKPTGQGVALRVSSGPEDRFVPPEVVGMTIGDATSLLVGLRLQAVEEPTYSPDVEVGIVLGVLPEIGSTVPADSAITVFVSAGPEPVEMPDIVGLALDEAIDELEALGLIFVDTEGTPGEAVIGSLPPIGATVDVGTEVLIYLDDPAEEDEEDN